MVLDVSGVQYDLKAIVCHIGPDASHGHYTARIHFPAAGGNWWYYNNTARRLAGDEELETTAAERSYILMYEQRFAIEVLEKKRKNKKDLQAMIVNCHLEQPVHPQMHHGVQRLTCQHHRL